MNVLIVEPKLTSIAPNIALMKLARLCELNGYDFQYIRGCVKTNFIPDRIYMSFIFTYYSAIYEKTIDFYKRLYPNAEIIIGGVFPTLFPNWFDKSKWKNPFFDIDRFYIHRGMYSDIETLIPKYNIDIIEEDKTSKDKQNRNSIVLYSSRGCTNKCKYCAVPTLEGKMKSYHSIKDNLEIGLKELPNAKSVVLYDNNFTAHEYFDNIVDELIDFGLPVDIHGLHVSAFTEHQAEKLAKLKWGSQGLEKSTAYIRFSFDKIEYRKHVDRALSYVKKYNIGAEFFCYMLYNFTDSPHDFWMRLVYSQEISKKYGKYIFLFPQRYEPFDAMKKYQYVGEKWTQEYASGIRKMTTWLHGFLSIFPNGNLFRWIGFTEKEFFEKVYKFGTKKNYRLIKNSTDDVPEIM
jgi:hypothetical protein